MVGLQVTFYCNFKNYPSNTTKFIVWTFQGSVGGSEETLYDSRNPNTYLRVWRSRASHILSETDLRVIVNNVTMGDMGNYTCAINDNYHINKKSLQVEVAETTSKTSQHQFLA